MQAALTTDSPGSYNDAERLVRVLQQRWHARLIETHISWVLLDGTHAWKFKKPVRLPFLDFTQLHTRQHLCEEELRLNRRLAPSLYLDVLPITGTFDAPDVGGQGEPIDHVLRMRQFPPGALMSERLQAGTLSPAHIDQLAVRLAAFHHAAPSASGDAVRAADAVHAVDVDWGSPARIVHSVQALIDGLRRQAASAVNEPAFAHLASWCERQAEALHDTWVQRQRDGHVIEGHGDLHLANVIVLDDDVTAFDCIEFDAALRWIDAMNDIAFLLMDLMAHGRDDLAWRLLNRYLDEGGDHAGLPVLRYYMVGRALVRAMVAGLPGAQHRAIGQGAAAPDYLGLAMRLTTPSPPALLITHGLSGSGKSWQTQQLLEEAGAIRLRSDVERRRLPFDGDKRYGPQAMASTYERLHERAGMALSAGYAVIVDATFLSQAERERFRALARAHEVPFHILHCEAPQAVLEQRIRERATRGDDASEADVGVLAQQRQSADALTAAEQACVIRLDAAQPQPIAHLLRQWRGRVSIDVCNGDADGLCATVQWRLQHPGAATLLTGLKRDIALLKQVRAIAGDEVRVFDLSMQRNQSALRALLDAGVHVIYADHHDTGDVPDHHLLIAHVDQGADTCTSLIVDRLLDGAHRAWALVGAYGDNLGEVADRLAEASGLASQERAALRQLGEAINYNAYGEVDEAGESDACIAPARLFERMLRHADPLDFIANEPIADALVCTLKADMQEALQLTPHWHDAGGAVYLMPDAAWARRVSGSFANALAQAEPQRAHAVITPTRGGGTHVVSVRAPLARPTGAGVLCRDFGGNGRTRAAGVDDLPAAELPRFVSAFANMPWGATQ